MTEPVSTALGEMVASPLLQQASQKAFGFLDRARQFAVDDARGCTNYLEAVYQAIVGLEAEYDRLLVEAKSCDLEDQEEVASLVKQIEMYLMGEHLRPALQNALAGLQQCSQALQSYAGRWLQRPSKRKDRQDAVKRLGDLLEDLESFLKSLEAKDHGDGMEISGVGAISLLEIKRYVEGYREAGKLFLFHQQSDDRIVLVHAITEAQKNRGKNQYLTRIANIQTVARQLVQKFR